MPFRTERDVARLALPEGKADAYHFDAVVRGLSVRLQGERRTYVAHYSTPDGRRRRLSLGDVAGLSLAEARRRAGEIVAGARAGADPLAGRAHARADGERTFGRIAALHLEARQKPDPTGSKRLRKALRPKSLVEVRRTLERHARQLHARPIDGIHAGDLKAVLATVATTSGPVAAARGRAHLSALFSWSIEKGFATSNPAAELPGGDASESRERVLDHREIATIWRATGGLGAYDAIVRLLLLTGARRSEVGGMQWVELDVEAATWRVPASRMKNGRPHTVFLAPRAVALLANQTRHGEHVFGRRSPFSGWSQCKRRLDAASGVTGWTIHDIRRTVATEMQKLGIRLEVAERILAHAATAGSRAGVVGVYQRHGFDDEARDGWNRWADRLATIVGE